MNIYLVELIVFLLLALFVTIIFKVKKNHKLKLILFTLFIIFSVSISGTYLLEKPHVYIVSPEINLQINQYSEIKVPHTTYHMKDVTSSVKIIGTVDYNKVGTYKIEYEVPTIVGEYNVEQTINVVDSIKPTITLKGDKVYNLSYSAKYDELGFTVEDNSFEDLTQKVKISKEEITDTEYDIIYSVEDSSGNTAVERRKVLIVDDIAPVISINGSANMRILVNSTYTEKGATAIDEKDGDLSDKIEISGKVNTSKVGEYKIKYTVSDKSGNKAETTRKVVVYKESTNPSSSGTGVIYLTFDDGPSSSITPKILDILKEKNVKATFFVLNYNSSLEYLIKREYNEGHSIGIHGYSHVYSEIYKSDEAFMNNVTKLQKKIAATIGYSPTIIRFPGGSSNTVSKNYNKGIMSRLSKTVIDAGFRYYDWNVSSGDAGGAQTSAQVYNNVVNNLSKSRSNVVLMHDFGGNTKTLNALADIIDYGLENGYIFKPITKDTPMVTHHISN